jgi:hypothetical protein
MKYLAVIGLCLYLSFDCTSLFAENENASAGQNMVGELDVILVEGVRASLRAAREVKQDELE